MCVAWINRVVIRSAALGLAAGLCLGGCNAVVPPPDNGNGNGNSNANTNDNGNDNSGELSPAVTFPTSLHATRAGKNRFYGAENGGFETLTGIPVEQMGCVKCHEESGMRADGTTIDSATYVPSCADCHADPSNPAANAVTEEICLECHSRQGVEMAALGDVHRDRGFDCTDCHSKREMHGDGTAYMSFLEDGVTDADCENCHKEGGIAGVVPTNTAHSIHSEKLDCAACHVQSVSTCYNCHLETIVAGAGKRFFGPPRTGFKMLMNYKGKVTTATFQALVNKGKSFYVIAPFFGHSIGSSPACDDCHDSPALNEYNDTGTITVTRWDAGQKTLIGPTGVIPIPPDWQTAIKMDFLDYTGDPADPNTDASLWTFLKTGADMTQMPFGSPLTDEQMQKLSQ